MVFSTLPWWSCRKPRGPPYEKETALSWFVLPTVTNHHLNSRSFKFGKEKVMKRLLIIASLVVTLCNVGAGLVYACECYENGVLACKGNDHCYHDAGGKCHCKDRPALEE